MSRCRRSRRHAAAGSGQSVGAVVIGAYSVGSMPLRASAQVGCCRWCRVYRVIDTVMARPSWVVRSVVNQRVAAARVRSRAWARGTARSTTTGAPAVAAAAAVGGGSFGAVTVTSTIMPTGPAAGPHRRARTDRSLRSGPAGLAWYWWRGPRVLFGPRAFLSAESVAPFGEFRCRSLIVLSGDHGFIMAEGTDGLGGDMLT